MRAPVITKRRRAGALQKSCSSSARYATLSCKAFQPFLRLLVMWKSALIVSKSAGVIKPPTVDQSCWMLDVQHLMIKDVLDKPLGNIDRVERLTYCNAVVNVIVMAENASCATLRPGQSWFFVLSIKIFAI